MVARDIINIPCTALFV